ncbi:hypothetical protein RND81_03G085700 [Saponaria officinalis]|uniref:Peptidase A1 domain-containing protein n=1 Tax=Saponaria officinalis TaxID=3572 RepID=A0AAW1M3S8_SAPOF
MSISRAYFMPRNKSLLRPNAFTVPLYEARGNYFVTTVTIGQGTTVHTPYLLLDTGESVTWVQCVGCNPCITSNLKNFDYKKSTSFRLVSLDDDICSPKLNYKGSCGYESKYRDSDSKSVGFMGRDYFRFNNTKTGFMEVFKGLAFGCGIENKGFEFTNKTGHTNPITGVHGLAPGKRSFINQLDHHIKGKFSYCIPSWTEEEFTQSTMYFGDDVKLIGGATNQVQVISMDTEVRYHLYMNGISVDGKRLSIDTSIFKLDPVSLTSGFIIDSGSPYTVLAKSAYDPFHEAILKFFRERYGWKTKPFNEDLKVCYRNKYPEDEDGFPIVIFHFLFKEQAREVDMVFNKDNMFMKFNGKGFCLMVLPTDDPGPCVLGAFQQANFNIMYDIPNNLLRFVRKRCNDDTNE